MIRSLCTGAFALVCITVCIQVRNALAPTKDRSLEDWFGSVEKAEEALVSLVDATVDVVSRDAEPELNRALSSASTVLIDPETTVDSGTVVVEGCDVLTVAHAVTLYESWSESELL
jgi:hypothetical protein